MASLASFSLSSSSSYSGSEDDFSRTPASIYSSEESLEQVNDEDEPLKSSFLMFCASCERQIDAPTYSRLYCSEECRQKDATPIQPYSTFTHDSYFPYTPPESPSRSSRASLQQLNSNSPLSPHQESGSPRNLTTKLPNLRNSMVTAPPKPEPPSPCGLYTVYRRGFLDAPMPVRSRRPQFNRSLTTGVMSAPPLNPRPATPTQQQSHDPLSGADSNPGTPQRTLPPRIRPSWSRASSSKTIDLVTPLQNEIQSLIVEGAAMPSDTGHGSPLLMSPQSLKASMPIISTCPNTALSDEFGGRESYESNLTPGRTALRQLFASDTTNLLSRKGLYRPLITRSISASKVSRV